MFNKNTLGILLLAAASTTAHGLELDGWYGEIGAGKARIGITDGLLATEAGLDPTVSYTAEDSATAYRVMVGKEVNSYIDMRVGYVSLGATTETLTDTAAPSVESIENSVKGILVALKGKFKTPVDKLFLTASGGFYRWSLDTEYTAAGAGVNTPFKLESRGVSQVFGVGLQYSITDNILVTADLDSYASIGHTYDNSAIRNGPGGNGYLADFDINSWMVGAQYRF